MENIPPLRGIRVLELGQLIAAPFAGSLLAGYGAEVIKVEPPKVGDPMRGWRKTVDGTSLWWYGIARNKKSVTIDLRKAAGTELIKKLVASGIDILIENFRPGRMEEWGLAYEDLKQLNPGLIMVRVSGWGQSGPYAQKPGFASVAEGVAGLRYITGEPDRPPVRTGLSIGDSLAGMHAVIGALLALQRRNADPEKRGQVVDVAIYESVFQMLESTLMEYTALGFERTRSGARLPGIVPSNTYRCADGKYVIVGGNGDSIFRRLMTAVGRSDLATDPELQTNPGRVRRDKEIDDAIEAYTLQHPLEEVCRVLEAAEVPVGPIYSIADIVNDPQFIARGMFENVKLPDGTPMQLPRFVPQLSETDAETKWLGPKLGEHNAEVFCDALGLTPEELQSLQKQGIV